MAEWHQNLHLGFSYQNMGVGEVSISKFCSETIFSMQGYSRHFSNSRGIFVNRSLLPNFHILKALAPLVCGNKISICRNHVLAYNRPQNKSIFIPTIWKNPLYYTVHRFFYLILLYRVFAGLHFHTSQ